MRQKGVYYSLLEAQNLRTTKETSAKEIEEEDDELELNDGQ